MHDSGQKISDECLRINLKIQYLKIECPQNIHPNQLAVTHKTACLESHHQWQADEVRF